MKNLKHYDLKPAWTCRSCTYRCQSPNLEICPLCSKPRQPRDELGRFAKRTDHQYPRVRPMMRMPNGRYYAPQRLEPLSDYRNVVGTPVRLPVPAKPEPSPEQLADQAELALYSQITGRPTGSHFTLEDWQNEFAITGQSIAWERMLAAVTEYTPSYLLDGPPAALAQKEVWSNAAQTISQAEQDDLAARKLAARITGAIAAVLVVLAVLMVFLMALA
jgi:hypothetical protein